MQYMAMIIKKPEDFRAFYGTGSLRLMINAAGPARCSITAPAWWQRSTGMICKSLM
jgi:hypothetical protein